MGGGLESHCVGRVCGAVGAVRQHHLHRTHDLRTYTWLVRFCEHDSEPVGCFRL